MLTLLTSPHCPAGLGSLAAASGLYGSRWQRSEVPLLWPPSCASSLPFHLYLWAGGWAPDPCIWGGPLSPGQSGTARPEALLVPSWPDQRPQTAPPCTWCGKVEEKRPTGGAPLRPIVVHCRWVLRHPLKQRRRGAPRRPHPSPWARSAGTWERQAASSPPASAASSCGTGVVDIPEDHMPAPSGQVS